MNNKNYKTLYMSILKIVENCCGYILPLKLKFSPYSTSSNYSSSTTRLIVKMTFYGDHDRENKELGSFTQASNSNLKQSTTFKHYHDLHVWLGVCMQPR